MKLYYTSVRARNIPPPLVNATFGNVETGNWPSEVVLTETKLYPREDRHVINCPTTRTYKKKICPFSSFPF